MKKKIIFVDDEENILNGLKRLLRSMNKEWDMFFAISGNDALKILKDSPCDIIVTDMRMPVMNGIQLLKVVQKKYPKMIRIILSGHSDKELILKSVTLAHQYLSKPCDAELLKSTINHAFDLRNRLMEDNIKELISKMETIPTMPNLYNELLEKLQSPDITLKRISQIIEKDVGMTAKILHLVNSSFFCISRTIYNTEEAVNFLGLDTIKSLVLSIEIFSQIKKPNFNYSIENLFNHSIICGNFAKIIAKYEKHKKEIISSSFLSGLLHDIGKLLLIKNYPNKYQKVIQLVKDKAITYSEAEQKIFNSTHSEVASYLLGIWGFPDQIIEAVYYHHRPDEYKNNNKSILTNVYFANVFHNQQCSNFETGTKIFNNNFIKELQINKKIQSWQNECYKSIMRKEQ